MNASRSETLPPLVDPASPSISEWRPRPRRNRTALPAADTLQARVFYATGPLDDVYAAAALVADTGIAVHDVSVHKNTVPWKRPGYKSFTVRFRTTPDRNEPLSEAQIDRKPCRARFPGDPRKFECKGVLFTSRPAALGLAERLTAARIVSDLGVLPNRSSESSVTFDDETLPVVAGIPTYAEDRVISYWRTREPVAPLRRTQSTPSLAPERPACYGRLPVLLAGPQPRSRTAIFAGPDWLYVPIFRKAEGTPHVEIADAARQLQVPKAYLAALVTRDCIMFER